MPSAEAYLAARTRHHGALAGDRAGTVTLNGDTFAAVVTRGPIELRPRQDGGGFVRIQKLSVQILKALLPQAPASGTAIIHESVTFNVEPVGGQNATDAAWNLTAVRFPQ